MNVKPYSWPAANEFLGREAELQRLNDWWTNSTREPINLYGRRRVGKSWLLRKFAHGKPALVLVAESTTPAQQLSKLADQMVPLLGLKPEIKDIGALFKLIYQLSESKILVVLDEFPYLLGGSATEIEQSLSTVQAIMEQYRDGTTVKLVICGSAIAQMEDLQSERNPLHGRLQTISLKPLEFSVARLFMPTLNTLDQFTRFSIAGGMPRYLSMLGEGTLNSTLARNIVDKDSPLFAEPISILQAELRETSIYMAILNSLATKPTSVGDISSQVGLDSRKLSPYLEKLSAVNIITKRLPIGAETDSRMGQWICADDFIRFWFRFVMPYEADLEAGTDAKTHIEQNITPLLANHTSPTFEELFRRWIRQEYPQASKVGAWWGPSLNHLRRTKERSSEEIDAVGMKHQNLEVVGEAKWTNKKMPMSVLTDLYTFKIPAMVQAGFRTPNPAVIVLVSRSGFANELEKAAANDSNIRLITAQDILERVR